MTTHPSKSHYVRHKSVGWLKGLYKGVKGLIKKTANDECFTKASTLSFYSLFAIVPLLAVLFGIAQRFGIAEAVERAITMRFFQQPEIANKLVEFAHSWLQNTKGGWLAGIGSIVLFWSAISLVNNLEDNMNSMWKVAQKRSYWHKIKDYLVILFIAPLFFIAASSINIYLTAQLTHLKQDNLFVETVTPVLLFILSLFPFILMWCLFTFVYVFIPNTKVHIGSALVAAVISGTFFQIWQWIYIQFQVGLSSYGSIYGSFAAFPLFLTWLQISWFIILAGAECLIAIQNGLFSKQ